MPVRIARTDRNRRKAHSGPKTSPPSRAGQVEKQPRHTEAERFGGILGCAPDNEASAPDFFGDLNLDQVIDAITAGRDDYDLKPFYYVSLEAPDAIAYRQEVFRDLERDTLFQHVAEFCEQMQGMRKQLKTAEKLYYREQKQRLFLDAVSTYCKALERLSRDLSRAKPTSRGIRAFREFLRGYLDSENFKTLKGDAETLYRNLSTIRYCMHIKGDRVSVRKAENEIDYRAEVEATFAKFRRGAVKSHLVDIPDYREMNHVEAAVVEMVAKLYPEPFRELDNFFKRRRHFADPQIAAFDREVQFYLAYVEHMRRLTAAGLHFCYSEILTDNKAVRSVDGFDIALAQKLVAEKAPVVCNEFEMRGAERIFVVTGPNQGGKTTFARTFGQLHFLASLGCPVPGKEARLFLFDRLFTHFEKEENVQNLRGKLEDDLYRIHEILEAATPRSIVIMNEIFTSTSLEDALFLGRKVLERIMARDTLAVCVTFLDELSSLGEKTVSVVSTVDPHDPAKRTFKLVRKPADGRAHAMAIAKLHRLAYGDLKERLGS